MGVSDTHLLYPGTSFKKMGSYPVFRGLVSVCAMTSSVLLSSSSLNRVPALARASQYSPIRDTHSDPLWGSPLITPCAQENHAHKRGLSHH